jgi:hypothetical protein
MVKSYLSVPKNLKVEALVKYKHCSKNLCTAFVRETQFGGLMIASEWTGLSPFLFYSLTDKLWGW